jgi:hypothetical protein
LYCLHSKPDDFPISQPKDLRVFRGDVRANFKEHFPQERLYQKMSDCLCEEEFIQLNNFRIVLSHRGTPPRSFEIGGENDGMATMPINPKYPSDQWENDFPVDAQTTTTRRQWLCDILEGLMDATVDFCNRQLP